MHIQNTTHILPNTKSISLQSKKDSITEKAADERQDIFELSKQYHDFESERILNQLKSSNDQISSLKKEMDTISKCLKIADRISSGDKVPKKDETFLKKNNPELYSQAIMLRVQNDDPKKHKSILEDENNTNQSKSENTDVSADIEVTTTDSTSEVSVSEWKFIGEF